MAGKQKQEPPVRTWAGLAKAVDVARNTLVRWRKHPTWTFTLPVDVEAVKAWRAATFTRDNATVSRGGEPSDAATALKAVRLIKVDLEGSILRGERVPGDVELAVLSAIVLRYTGEIEELVGALPMRLAGLSRSEIASVLAERREHVHDATAGVVALQRGRIEHFVPPVPGHDRGRPADPKGGIA